MTLFDIAYILIIILLLVLSFIITYGKMHDIFNPPMITALFVFIPYLLSLFRLSSLQEHEYHAITYILFFIDASVIFILSIGLENKMNSQKISKISFKHLRYIDFLFYVFVGLYLLQNLISTHHLIPIIYIATLGDTHLLHVTLVTTILYILKNLLPALYFFIYDNYNKRKYLIFSILSLLVPLSNGSRSSIIISLYIILCYKISKFKLNLRNVKTLTKIFIILVFVVSVLVYFGELRLKKYNYAYAIGLDNIQSSSLFKSIFSWYYGYFSLSYYNLDNSIVNWMSNPTYYFGLINFNGILTTVLQLHHIIPSYPTIFDFDSRRISVSGYAVTATAKYYFIMDYGIIGSIVINSIYYLILYYIYRLSSINKYNRLLYCIFSLQVVFYSFYSLFYSVYFIPMLIILILLKKFGFIKINTISK